MRFSLPLVSCKMNQADGQIDTSFSINSLFKKGESPLTKLWILTASCLQFILHNSLVIFGAFLIGFLSF